MLHNQKTQDSFPKTWGTLRRVPDGSRTRQIGVFVSTKQEDEDGAPLDSAGVGDVPVKSGVEPVPTSGKISSTRTSKAWIGLLPGLVVLVVILVFVFQNSKDVKVSLFTFSGTLPLSVALLGAVILGALMVLALGSVRILQLRRQVRQSSRRDPRHEHHERRG